MGFTSDEQLLDWLGEIERWAQGHPQASVRYVLGRMRDKVRLVEAQECANLGLPEWVNYPQAED